MCACVRVCGPWCRCMMVCVVCQWSGAWARVLPPKPKHGLVLLLLVLLLPLWCCCGGLSGRVAAWCARAAALSRDLSLRNEFVSSSAPSHSVRGVLKEGGRWRACAAPSLRPAHPSHQGRALDFLPSVLCVCVCVCVRPDRLVGDASSGMSRERPPSPPVPRLASPVLNPGACRVETDCMRTGRLALHPSLPFA